MTEAMQEDVQEEMVPLKAMEAMRNLFLFAVMRLGGKIEITHDEYETFLNSHAAFFWGNANPELFVVEMEHDDPTVASS